MVPVKNKSIIGLKRGAVNLVRYNQKWKQVFERESKKIRKIFGKDALKLQHVGSTAIPGMSAKPIIDIVLIIASFRKVKRYEKKLQKIGYYLYKGDSIKERLFFRKGSRERRTHYLHISEVGSGYGENLILFKDYLCENKDAFKRYFELKKKLAKKYPNERKIYTEKKTKLVKAILTKAKKSMRTKI